MEKSTLIGLVVVAIIAIGGYFTPMGQGVLSVLGGITNYDAIDVTDGYYVDGTQIINGVGAWIGNIAATGTTTISGNSYLSPTAISTTTTGGNAATLSQSDLMRGQYWTVNINQAADYTFTLPASTTLGTILPSTGNQATWTFDNATTTADIDLVFVAGAGIDLQMATGTSAIETVGPTDSARLTLIRKSNTDFFGILEIFDDTD